MSIPATYKAAVYDEPGTISTKIVELPTPEPEEGQVLIKLYVPRTTSACKVLLTVTPLGRTLASAILISAS